MCKRVVATPKCMVDASSFAKQKQLVGARQQLKRSVCMQLQVVSSSWDWQWVSESVLPLDDHLVMNI